MDLAKHSPNILTFSRLVLSPIAFLFILSSDEDYGSSWYLFVFAILVSVSDTLDGRLARHYKVTSRWGTFFDPLADKIIVLGSALCFVFVDRYWILPVIFLFIREVFIGVLRLYHVSKGYSVPASFLAKGKTTFQGLALGLAAFPPFKEYATVHVVFIWIAVGVTLMTGIEYIAAIPKMQKEEK